jgi:two-component SAPR family response regulator
MFIAIAVDDESRALDRFERVASTDGRISIDGKFLYAEDALAFVREHPVDLAFLDIEMPEMSGLELAERLLEIDPYIKVIFISAYNQYALDAFRAHAIGYLLKPLDTDEFKEQLDLFDHRFEPRPALKENQRLNVKCFGCFSVTTDTKTTSVIRWKTSKAEELFALLLHYQGRSRPRESLIDTLWPELEPEKSANLFRVTCTYLRSALAEKGFPDILRREADGYRINTNMINCDLFKLRQLNRAVAALDLNELEEASELYAGEYLESKSYDWARETRTKTESDFKKIQYRLADEYLKRGNNDKAAEVLERTLTVDPCDEEAVMRLVDLKLKDGDHMAAKKAYRNYEKILMEQFGIEPSVKLPPGV